METRTLEKNEYDPTPPSHPKTSKWQVMSSQI